LFSQPQEISLLSIGKAAIKALKKIQIKKLSCLFKFFFLISRVCRNGQHFYKHPFKQDTSKTIMGSAELISSCVTNWDSSGFRG